MTLLDEAIERAERIADSYNDTAPDCKSAKDHRRLASWLKELKLARESAFSEIPQMAQTISENHSLKRQNEEMRELLCDYDKVLDACVDVWGITADALGYGRKYDVLHSRFNELVVKEAN